MVLDELEGRLYEPTITGEIGAQLMELLILRRSRLYGAFGITGERRRYEFFVVHAAITVGGKLNEVVCNNG